MTLKAIRFLLIRSGCLAIASLLVGQVAAAQSLFKYSQTIDESDLKIESTFETSAECEARVASQIPDSQVNQSKASQMMVIEEDCRTSCERWEAPSGYKWFGKAPSCTGKKMNKNKQAYTDCVGLGGEPVSWSYCGDGSPCLTGSKILCKLPSDDYYFSLAGTEGTITWFGKPPACNASNAEKDCIAAGGTKALESKCSDGSSGQNADCCTTGKMVACVLPKPEPTVFQGQTVETYVKWYGKAPACVASNGEADCANMSGTVEKKDRCTDGTDGEKVTCCTTGKKVKCIIPKNTTGN